MLSTATSQSSHSLNPSRIKCNVLTYKRSVTLYRTRDFSPMDLLDKAAGNAFDGMRKWLDPSWTPNPEYASDHELLRDPFFNLESRMELPMIVHGAAITSRPDSGSEENIILAGLVTELGLLIDSSPEHQKEFRLANGKVVKALGQIIISCSFEKGPKIGLSCLFYVFEFLITPIIMGMTFLEETETLNKHRYRLQPRSTPPAALLQLCSIGYPRRRLYCLADDEPQFATADTGSEIDLISPAYIKKRGLVMAEIDVLRSVVQLADGSTSRLLGKVFVSIVLGNSESPPYLREFYVLDGLTCDILLGEDFLEQVSAFTTYHYASSIDDEDDGVRAVNTIIWFNTVEWGLSRLVGRGKSPRLLRDQNGENDNSRPVTL